MVSRKHRGGLAPRCFCVRVFGRRGGIDKAAAAAFDARGTLGEAALGKLITLLLLAGAVYAAWRWLRRAELARDAEARAAQPGIPTETMVKCRVCGVYVPAEGARNCGYADCPYGR